MDVDACMHVNAWMDGRAGKEGSVKVLLKKEKIYKHSYLARKGRKESSQHTELYFLSSGDRETYAMSIVKNESLHRLPLTRNLLSYLDINYEKFVL